MCYVSEQSYTMRDAGPFSPAIGSYESNLERGLFLSYQPPSYQRRMPFISELKAVLNDHDLPLRPPAHNERTRR